MSRKVEIEIKVGSGYSSLRGLKKILDISSLI